eukprot:5232054-Prymnesium_polylepis.1
MVACLSRPGCFRKTNVPTLLAVPILPAYTSRSSPRPSAGRRCKLSARKLHGPRWSAQGGK